MALNIEKVNFNLSDKIMEIPKGLTCACGKCDLSNIKTKYVKEFIKVIKEDFELFKLQQFGISVGMSPKFNIFLEQINKRAGDKLNGT